MVTPWVFLAFGIVIAILLAYRRLERSYILALKWPDNVGYYTMSRFVDSYLRYHGWKIHTNRNLMHIKIARRPGQVIRIVCVPSFLEVNASRIKDICQIAMTTEDNTPQPYVCITAREAPPHLVPIAAAGYVLLLHYKQMHLFKDHGTNQSFLFETMRREHRGTLAATNY